MNRRELLYLALFASAALLLAGAVAAGAWYALPRSPELRVILDLVDYPPGNTPTLVVDGDFWLAHTPQGELFAFVPTSPESADHVSVDPCRYIWNSANGRFIDPCSGDEWELDGTLNLRHSTELWSNQGLYQYPVSVEDGKIIVYVEKDWK